MIKHENMQFISKSVWVQNANTNYFQFFEMKPDI